MGKGWGGYRYNNTWGKDERNRELTKVIQWKDRGNSSKKLLPSTH